MAQNSGNPKFPPPIANPLHQKAQDEDKTDPELLHSPVTEEEKTPIDLIKPEQASSQVEKRGPQRPFRQNPQGQKNSQQPSATPSLAPLRMPEMGPLDALMKDPSISEIMVNDLRNVIVEKNGVLQTFGFTYRSLDELNHLTRNILDITGRVLTPEQPYVDTMLADGSRVNIVAPPLTLIGPCITIRKFPSQRPSIHDLMANETLDQRIAYFLNVCVLGKLNLLVCGGTGSGKTTLLNVLTSLIPKAERLITIEDTPELSIQHVNSVRLQTKPQSPSTPAITARDLVANALRMRPDRIIVGECRRSEAFDMLQAMNTGHLGSMTTIHANSPRDGLTRLETLCMLAGIELPLIALRKQISSAVDLIIQVKRFRNGKRRVVAITEVTGIEAESITLQDIFTFEAEATESGVFKATGMVPTFIDRLRDQGIELPRNYFG